MRNPATNLFPAQKPLKCLVHLMMVFIGWGFLVVFSLSLCQQKVLHNTNQETNPRSMRGPTAERQACCTR